MIKVKKYQRLIASKQFEVRCIIIKEAIPHKNINDYQQPNPFADQTVSNGFFNVENPT